MAEISNRLGQRIQTVHETGQLLSSKVQELERSAQISVQTAEKNGRNLQMALMQQQERLDLQENRLNNLLETIPANQPVEKRESLLFAEVQSLGVRLNQMEQGIPRVVSENQELKETIVFLENEEKRISEDIEHERERLREVEEAVYSLQPEEQSPPQI